jgi:DNA modification methylase
VWNFPDRGNWATHDGTYRGNWSPYVPRNLILRYSKEGDMILDQFAGGGTTLVEAKLLRRNVIGVDVNDDALRRCKEKCSFHWESNYNVYLKHGDARKLNFIPNEKIDLICTHPPYANMVKYSCGLKDDLSQLEVPDFFAQMKFVSEECYRVLKPDHYCAILMGDIRRNGFIVDLSFRVMQIFLGAGFKLKETIIKQQHNCKHTEKWRDISVQRNFLLVAHEYLFVFKK